MITRTSTILHRKIGREFATAAATSSLIATSGALSSTSSIKNEENESHSSATSTVPRADNPNDHRQTEVNSFNKNHNNNKQHPVDLKSYFPASTEIPQQQQQQPQQARPVEQKIVQAKPSSTHHKNV